VGGHCTEEGENLMLGNLDNVVVVSVDYRMFVSVTSWVLDWSF
jgi:hypothetical protein